MATISTKRKEYKPGDTVKSSGIYQVVHDQKHTEPHEVTVVFGKKFPPCNDCGNHPRFVLVHWARHIDQDDNFKN